MATKKAYFHLSGVIEYLDEPEDPEVIYVSPRIIAESIEAALIKEHSEIVYVNPQTIIDENIKIEESKEDQNVVYIDSDDKLEFEDDPNIDYEELEYKKEDPDTVYIESDEKIDEEDVDVDYIDHEIDEENYSTTEIKPDPDEVVYVTSTEVDPDNPETNYDNVEIIIETLPMDRKKLTCRVCDKVFPNYKKLAYHEPRHKYLAQPKICACRSEFRNLLEYREHKAATKAAGNPCEICHRCEPPRNWETKYKLWRHWGSVPHHDISSEICIV